MRKPTVSLIGAVLAAAAFTPTSAHAAGPQIDSGLGCAAACIDQALLEPNAHSVRVRVRTEVPAKIVAGVRKRAIGDSPYLDSSSSMFRTTRWLTRLEGLEPDRLYEFEISATDAQGRTYHRVTTFRTKELQSLGDDLPNSVDSGAGCAAQCIRTAQAAVGGREAEITVNTNVPVKLAITADRGAPAPTSLGPMFVGRPDARLDTGVYGKSYKGRLAGLQPDSRYNVIIRATDANGRVAWREGTLDTDARHARVVFDRIKVHADADKGRNRGEIQFRVALGEDVQFHLKRDEDKIKSGKTVHLPKGGEQTFTDTGQHMLIQVQGIERDWKGCFSSDQTGEGLLDPLQGKGKWDCNRWTWSIAQGFFDLDSAPAPDALPGGFGGGGTVNFSLPVARSDLRFTVDGHVDVWYG